MAAMNRRDALALGASSVLALTQIRTLAHAQPAAYPTKPVRLLLPFPAGGGQDAFARNFIPLLSGDFGARILIDNRPGANTALATELAARATPDGHTLIQQTNSFTSNPALRNDLVFDSVKDFAPVSLVARTPHVLIISPKLPVTNVNEFAAYAKASQKRVNYGSSGIGSTNHLAGAMLAKAIGADMEHILYKGAVQFLRDVMSGDLEIALSGSGQAVGLAKNGRVRALAVTADDRIASMPDVPTFKELGLNVVIYSWTGYLAPARTPSDIIDKLASIMQATCRDPKVREKFPEHELIGSNPADFGRFLASDFVTTAELLKNVKAAPER